MVRWIGFIMLLTLLLPWPGRAAETTHSLEILDVTVYPAAEADFNKLAGFTWPDITDLNAQIGVRVGGFTGEEKLDLYMVVLDEDDEIVSKHKGKHYLPPGEHDLVFPAFISTAQVFGEHGYRVKVEADMAGVKPLYAEHSFQLAGPPAPKVDIVEIGLYDVEGDRREGYFTPGDEFLIIATVEIEDNASDIKPKIILFAMMDEDYFLIDPDMASQPYDAHWDSRELDSRDGLFEIRTTGRLPYFFAEPYEFRHEWRVYVLVDFGPGLVESDYAGESLYDHNSGENRYSDQLMDRLIEIDRGYKWDVRRLRGDRPDTDRFWEERR